MVTIRIGLLCALMILFHGTANAGGNNGTKRSIDVGRIYYPTPSSRNAPGILVIGGAEGGSAWAEAVAQMLADHGYVAVSEAYFNAPELPPRLQLIPLERFSAGIDQLASDPRVDRRHIAVLGFSKGAEAALLVASKDRRIKAVVAGSPSDVIWQGIDRQSNSVVSSWSSGGIPLPFVAFANCPTCRTLADLYTKSRESIEPEAMIAAEKINGPILMTASDQDAIWPSRLMADAVTRRLAEKRFRHKVQTLRYPDGGHFTLGPLAPNDAEGDAGFGGGTAEGVIAARRDSWSRILSFFDHAFRDAADR